MLFKTHGIPVCPGCRDQEEQRLCSGITGTLGHDIEQFPVRLCVQLIKDDRMDVQSMLCVCLCRQHLVEAVGWFIYKPFYGHDGLDPFLQCRTLVHHIHRNIKYDGSLLPVRSTAVNLCSPFTITACHIQCNGSRQLRFSVFLWYLTVTGIVLPVSVFLYRPIKGTDDLILPREKFKRNSPPPSFGVFQAVYKIDRMVCFCLIKHYFASPFTSRSSISSFCLSSPLSVEIRLLADGVRPNCSQNLFIIFR